MDRGPPAGAIHCTGRCPYGSSYSERLIRVGRMQCSLEYYCTREECQSWWTIGEYPSYRSLGTLIQALFRKQYLYRGLPKLRTTFNNIIPYRTDILFLFVPVSFSMGVESLSQSFLLPLHVSTATNIIAPRQATPA